MGPSRLLEGRACPPRPLGSPPARWRTAPVRLPRAPTRLELRRAASPLLERTLSGPGHLGRALRKTLKTASEVLSGTTAWPAKGCTAWPPPPPSPSRGTPRRSRGGR
eukprot:873409-Heterocapsa_arctica.AAC.1